MAEQLALDQLVGNRRAVDLDERSVAPQALAWIARATSSLPTPLSPRISTVALVGAAFWMACAPRPGRRIADDLVLLLGVAGDSGLFSVVSRRVSTALRTVTSTRSLLERLLDEVERAEPGRFDGGGNVGVAGNDDDRHGFHQVPQPLQHFDPVHAPHLDVEEHEIGRVAFDLLDAFFAGGRVQHLVALVLEVILKTRMPPHRR